MPNDNLLKTTSKKTPRHIYKEDFSQTEMHNGSCSKHFYMPFEQLPFSFYSITGLGWGRAC
ncbi:hypothetical protein HMPREF1991_00316 [Hoylesella loescheii DSM 19665 = JCM 12249 = ATCC 15930]|uniref:Uncharacterized protein n=1 Tax=Hoylesella loescheii DSM 19665 = JCM 12249 = ATCC 15930 TaxID=1122985 RepID=A0A069QLF3_HOYLO|nr:hypothetical protein HMPREF1991_00316 [Hoylesella loescheii DSM 19665 = JCM 12249 = ATCC 15930]